MSDEKHKHRHDELFTSGHTACGGCGAAIIFRMLMKILGHDTIVVNPTGCAEIFTSQFPRSAWRVPYIHSLFENAPAVATGVRRALEAQGNNHTKVVVIAGDGATYDIGFGALSGMFERNEDVLYICYDNEAYMNTGVQRSGSTPLHARTTTSEAGKKIHGKPEIKKPIVDIAAAHRIPYAASANVAFFPDFERKIKKAMNMRGSRFINIFSTCDTGWGTATDIAFVLSKLAVETGVFKLFEIENGKLTLNYAPKKLTPVREYLALQRRFRHLSDEEINELQQMIYREWGRNE
ncbi:MAG: thiamine pyrophosphate-dependent enzyme [Candidatus Micrarchaeota archaeon]